MKPQVIFSGNQRQGMLQSGAGWQVQTLDWQLPGGSANAVISAPVQDANAISLRMLQSWLGQAVEIHNEVGECIWSGWIEEINLDVRRVRLSWSTRQLVSRVIARYPCVSPMLDPSRRWGYTEWFQDDERMQQLGAKEALLNLPDGDANKAGEMAVRHLVQKGMEDNNGLVLLPDHQMPRLEMRLKGWWQRLDWTLDAEEDGILAHLDGGKSQQAVGITGSERLAQSFTTGSDPFPLGQVDVRVAMLGAASDDLRLKICSDNAGVPGAELVNCTLANASLQGGWDWQQVLLEEILLLNASTRYWLMIERSGALDNSQYFQIETDDGRGYPDGECKRWNGSSWVLLEQDVRFCLLAATRTSELMHEVGELAVQAGVLQGVQVWVESGIGVLRRREIGKTRRQALQSWLEMGCADGGRLSALVNAQRILEVFRLPRDIEPELQMDADGKIIVPHGCEHPQPLYLLGRRIHLPFLDAIQPAVVRGLRWTREGGLEIVES